MSPPLKASARHSLANAYRVALAPIVAVTLFACESSEPAPAPSPAPTEQGLPLRELKLEKPLRVTIERADPAQPFDAQHETLLIHANGLRLRLELTRNDELVSADYRTFEVGRDERLQLRAASERAPFCHFRGHLVEKGATDSVSVAITTCDAAGREAYRGLLYDTGRLIELRPSLEPGTYELALTELPALIDELEPGPTEPNRPRAPALAPRAIGPTGPGGELWIQALAMNDQRRVSALGSVSASEQSTLAIMNQLGGLYRGTSVSPPLRIGLVAQVSFTTDPYAPTMSGTEVVTTDLLSKFSSYVSTATLPAHDQDLLFSGYDFQGSTVGLSYVGALCGTSPASIVQGGFSVAATAVIAGHETGHALGMNHDEALGCAGGFIMSSSVCVNCAKQPTDFSSCSQASLSSFLRTNVGCLADPISSTFQGPSCGNGIREAGEQCDCGAPNCATRDPCCSGSTCRLAAGAACSAEDKCCNSQCLPLPVGTVCRPSAGNCDSAETCNGTAQCPADEYQPAGSACSDGVSSSAACYRGRCLSREEQCHDLEASYNLGTLAPCDSASCGPARCHDASNVCYSFNDHPLLDGTPCGSGKQCSGNACVSSSQLEPRAPVPTPAPATSSLCLLFLATCLMAIGAISKHRAA